MPILSGLSPDDAACRHAFAQIAYEQIADQKMSELGDLDRYLCTVQQAVFAYRAKLGLLPHPLQFGFLVDQLVLEGAKDVGGKDGVKRIA